MIAAIIILSIATAVLLITHISYRRQVKKTCRRIAFIKNNDTNMQLLSDMNFHELNMLEKEINEVIEKNRQISIAAKRSENNLKETIVNISHDIRTPLTSLDGFFQLLKNADSEEERDQCVDVIQNRINNLKYMLEELFTYTKLQNDDYKLATEPVDIVRCVSSALVSFYNEFQEKSIEVQADFTDKEAVVDCNSEAVQRIVQNILKNVLDHGSKAVELTLKQDTEKVVFTCSNKVDNPESIDVSQVFTRFYKSDPARTHSSTGLGLAIAKGLAERMNGGMTAQVDGEWFRVEVWFSKIQA